MKETAIINPQRRKFLSTVKIASAVTVVALLAKKMSEPSLLPAEPAEGTAALPSSYHETEHIRKYYRSAALM